MSKTSPVWFLLLALMSQPALAHKLKVFAQTEGDWIRGRAYFVGGAGASGARVEIQDSEGRVLAELTPADDGSFAYRALAPVEHRLVARTGDGHRARWTIAAETLQGAFLEPIAATSDPGDGSERPLVQAQPLTAVAPTPTASFDQASTDSRTADPALIGAIEQALARQTQPLAERLNALEERIRFQDVLGGIGYILGLTGLTLWWRCRRTGERA
ncbi:MAG: carboxypeptidase-like regulatory domain-containing protein [Chromatiales bacterium]|nr:carboxypeptidase-like regulatory domain-containing protein [Chromatiales bacterium]